MINTGENLTTDRIVELDRAKENLKKMKALEKKIQKSDKYEVTTEYIPNGTRITYTKVK